jgi:hypothetical protein
VATVNYTNALWNCHKDIASKKSPQDNKTEKNPLYSTHKFEMCSSKDILCTRLSTLSIQCLIKGDDIRGHGPCADYQRVMALSSHLTTLSRWCANCRKLKKSGIRFASCKVTPITNYMRIYWTIHELLHTCSWTYAEIMFIKAVVTKNN